MTYATDTFNGDGSTDEFTITFDYIQRDHVTVSRVVKATQLATVLTVIASGTPTGDQYVWETDKKIKVGTAPATTDELKVERDTPENQQLVQWKDGSYIIAADLNTSDLQFLYGLQELEDKFGKLQSTAIKYLGAIDLTVDAAPASPSNGDFYINVGSGAVLDSWTGIGGDAVVGSEQVAYNSTISEWQIFQVPSSQSGVLQVKSTAPITVDETNVQRPVVGITNATASADGAMSSADKTKLDGIAAGAEVNVPTDLGYTAATDKGTVTSSTGTDATVPLADGTNAGLITAAEKAKIGSSIGDDAPSDGKTYGRKDAAWSEVQPGGVTSIIAGNGISVDQATGDVTVTATGGGGGGVTSIIAGEGISIDQPTGAVTITSNATPGVSYQQGTFLATVKSAGGASLWMQDGQIINDNVYEYSTFNWWRIGQIVTINVYLRVKSAGNGSDSAGFTIEGYPYKSKEGSDNDYYQYFVCTSAIDFITPATAYPTIFAQTINLPGQSAYPGDRSLFLFTDPDLAMASVASKVIKANGQLYYTLSYQTDDTTWQPLNGATVDP